MTSRERPSRQDGELSLSRWWQLTELSMARAARPPCLVGQTTNPLGGGEVAKPPNRATTEYINKNPIAYQLSGQGVSRWSQHPLYLL